MKPPETSQSAHHGAKANDRRTTIHTGGSKAFAIASWAAVVAVAMLIFAMSAKDGAALDTGSGLLSAAKAWLADALESLAQRPVDVSPLGHFAEYLLFGAVLANALRLHFPLRTAGAVASVAASLYGVTDEIHQIFVPLRSCDPADWAVDTVAACLGAALVCAALARREASRPRL